MPFSLTSHLYIMGRDYVSGIDVLRGGVCNVPKGKYFPGSIGNVIEVSALLETNCINFETQITVLFILQWCKNC